MPGFVHRGSQVGFGEGSPGSRYEASDLGASQTPASTPSPSEFLLFPL